MPSYFCVLTVYLLYPDLFCTSLHTSGEKYRIQTCCIVSSKQKDWSKSEVLYSKMLQNLM